MGALMVIFSLQPKQRSKARGRLDGKGTRHSVFYTFSTNCLIGKVEIFRPSSCCSCCWNDCKNIVAWVNCSVSVRECSASVPVCFGPESFPLICCFSLIFSSKFMVPHQQSMKLTWNQPPFGKHFSRNSTNFLDFFSHLLLPILILQWQHTQHATSTRCQHSRTSFCCVSVSLR